MELYPTAQDSMTWYATLIKPPWAPPSWLFGPVWSVLYLLIIVSFGYVFWRWWQGTLPTSVMLIFAVNLAANIAFSPVQFWLRSNVLASVDVLVVLASLGYAMYRVYPLVPWVTYMNIPYLAWVSFASVLQLTVTYLNLGK